MGDVSVAPSAPGFDPLGNPTPMGEAPGNTSRSYRRDERGSGGSLGVPQQWSGQELDWYQWLNAQWQDQGPPPGGANMSQQFGNVSSTGLENLTSALQNGTQTPVSISGPGDFASLSQWQLHQTSTHKKMGPAAQGLFRQQPRGAGRRSTSALGDRSRSVSTGGRMHQGASSSMSNRPSLKPSWQRNRKDGLTPLGGGGQARNSAPAPGGGISFGEDASSGPTNELSQPQAGARRRISRGNASMPLGDGGNRDRSRTLRASGQDLHRMNSKAVHIGDQNADRPGLADAAGPEFDDDYSRKQQLKSEVGNLIKEGEKLLTMIKALYLSDPTAVVVDPAPADAPPGVDDKSPTNILFRASGTFQKALAIDMNNLKARSGLKRAEALAGTPSPDLSIAGMFY